MPSQDSELPYIMAMKVINSESTKVLLEGILGSDRPPFLAALFVGAYQLVGRGIDSILLYQYFSTFIQLTFLWGLISIFEFLNFTSWQKKFVLISCVFSWSIYSNCTYVWPKMMTVTYFSFVFITSYSLITEKEYTRQTAWEASMIGVSAAFAMLSHGGIAFAFVGLGVILLWRYRMNFWLLRNMILTFFLSYLPWMYYQKTIAPPGNRLLKWHLAGAVEIDDRSFIRTFLDAYESLSWREWVACRMMNLRGLFPPEWKEIGSLGRYYVITAIGVSLILCLILLQRKSWLSFRRNVKNTYLLVTIISMVFAEVVLMYMPGSCSVGQSAYPIIVFPFLLVGAVIPLYRGKVIPFCFLVANILNILPTFKDIYIQHQYGKNKFMWYAAILAAVTIIYFIVMNKDINKK